MKRYNLFAGLGGGYGGAYWICTEYYKDSETAEFDARIAARELWESYGGISGVEGYSYDEYIHEVGEDEANDDEYDQLDEEAFDAWADYYVEEVPAEAGDYYEYDGDLR